MLGADMMWGRQISSTGGGRGERRLDADDGTRVECAGAQSSKMKNEIALSLS